MGRVAEQREAGRGSFCLRTSSVMPSACHLPQRGRLELFDKLQFDTLFDSILRIPKAAVKVDIFYKEE